MPACFTGVTDAATVGTTVANKTWNEFGVQRSITPVPRRIALFPASPPFSRMSCRILERAWSTFCDFYEPRNRDRWFAPWRFPRLVSRLPLSSLVRLPADALVSNTNATSPKRPFFMRSSGENSSPSWLARGIGVYPSLDSSNVSCEPISSVAYWPTAFFAFIATGVATIVSWHSRVRVGGSVRRAAEEKWRRLRLISSTG